MKKILHNIIIYTLLSTSLFVFSSCSFKKNNKNETSESAESTIKCYEFEPATEIVEGRDDIYVVLKVITGQYWEDIINGITDAGNDKGYNIYIGGCASEDDWKVQEKLLGEARDKKADAIILAPANSSKLEEAANQIHDNNIPLVLVDTILTSGYYDICYMTDNFQAGQMAAEEMLSMLKTKGYKDSDTVQVAIQVTSIVSQTVVDRMAGFNKYWFSNAPENWSIIDEVKFNMGNIDVAVQNGKDFLKSYPDLKGFVACNNSSSVGFATSLKEENRMDIILSAFDYSDIVAEMIADKECTAATVVQKQYNMGYNGVASAHDLINGDKNDCKFIDTGVMVVNEGNYKEYESGK